MVVVSTVDKQVISEGGVTESYSRRYDRAKCRDASEVVCFRIQFVQLVGEEIAGFSSALDEILPPQFVDSLNLTAEKEEISFVSERLVIASRQGNFAFGMDSREVAVGGESRQGVGKHPIFRVYSAEDVNLMVVDDGGG